MARTLQQIKDSILTAKQAESELSGLTEPPSQTAIWWIWVNIVTTCHWILENLFDEFKTDVNTMIEESIPNSIPWLYDQVGKFQYGDDLAFINNKYQYEIIDATKQIIKRRSIVEVGNYVIIKIATITNGVLQPIDVLPLAAFTSYIGKIKAPGQRILIYNYLPDQLNISADVYYNPLVMLPSGELINEPGVIPVTDMINQYIDNIVFGGEFNINKLQDAICEATGIPDSVINLVEVKPYNAALFSAITHKHVAISGYYIINTLTLNYIPNV